MTATKGKWQELLEVSLDVLETTAGDRLSAWERILADEAPFEAMRRAYEKNALILGLYDVPGGVPVDAETFFQDARPVVKHGTHRQREWRVEGATLVNTAVFSILVTNHAGQVTHFTLSDGMGHLLGYGQLGNISYVRVAPGSELFFQVGAIRLSIRP